MLRSEDQFTEGRLMRIRTSKCRSSRRSVFGATVFAIGVLISGWAASAHDALGLSDWIGEGTDKYLTPGGHTRCCGRNDCAKIDSDAVTYGPNGLEIHGGATYFLDVSPETWLRQRIDETVPYAELLPSEDKSFWRCQWPGPRNPGPETPPHRTCFFAPPPGS
jgi:hypothetical protein